MNLFGGFSVVPAGLVNFAIQIPQLKLRAIFNLSLRDEMQRQSDGQYLKSVWPKCKKSRKPGRDLLSFPFCEMRSKKQFLPSKRKLRHKSKTERRYRQPKHKTDLSCQGESFRRELLETQTSKTLLRQLQKLPEQYISGKWLHFFFL